MVGRSDDVILPSMDFLCGHGVPQRVLQSRCVVEKVDGMSGGEPGGSETRSRKVTSGELIRGEQGHDEARPGGGRWGQRAEERESEGLDLDPDTSLPFIAMGTGIAKGKGVKQNDKNDQ